ncbi:MULTISPECIES: hypothetical protein [unclassified Streptomyces]|uniref:hypothetical protein n=1 Tax=unclassified Streptomyces TaxID=2593676 RepID=UPI0033E5ACBD
MAHRLVSSGALSGEADEDAALVLGAQAINWGSAETLVPRLARTPVERADQ